tara:strand:- start:499 stop:1059 length:561 start_codon:yes stop_codon:yes gene_type:complete
VSSNAASATGLTDRYATALFDLADEKRQLKKVSQDLEALGNLLESSPDLNKLVLSPVISRNTQVKALNVILASMNVSNLTKNFVGVIAKNGRLSCLSAIVNAYKAVLSDRKGETAAQVVSAQELTAAEVNSISTALHKFSGGKVSINLKVDKSLLGGLIVQIGSQMIDSSLKSKLQQLRLTMKGVS